MADDMIILSRVFDLLAWLLPKGERFPRAYRYTVTQRLMDAALDLQDGLYLAQSRSAAARRAALADCDAALNRLRLYLRLAHHWHWLSDGQYAHVSGMVAEIGRLLGGWIRSDKAKPQPTWSETCSWCCAGVAPDCTGRPGRGFGTNRNVRDRTQFEAALARFHPGYGVKPRQR